MYNQFLQSNPNHVQSHFNLAYELKAENNGKTAVVHFNKAIELRSSYRWAHRHLATCYRVLGNEEMATHHELIFQSKNQNNTDDRADLFLFG